MDTMQGVNIGGWLVLEKWITPSLFTDTEAQDEYTFCQKYSKRAYEIIQQHRNSFITQRESGWNHLASNRSSGAHGIPQALPGRKMGPGWESDPSVQIRWGIGYMVNRYGSPCGAQAFWNINHWY